MMHHRWILIGLFLISGIGLLASDASAGTVRNACKEDVKTYCKGVKQGQGRIKACLDAHKSELSSTCSSAMADMKTSCQSDREKFCKDVQEGEGRIMACLQEHESELSEACRKTYK